MSIIEYMVKPQGPVLEEYYYDRSPFSCIIGPLGSGKTITTINKIFSLMCEQEPNDVGVRLTRFVAVRNTYSDLMNTTIKDWRECHDDLGVFTMGSNGPPKQVINFMLEDGTEVQSEILFIAFDRPDDVKKARGLQLTWVWANELKELDKAVIDMLDLRHGRYPSAKEGVDCTQHGILADTNAPDEDHWLYNLAEEVKPQGWKFLKQPGGVMWDGNGWVFNPKAENVQNLPGGKRYYERGMQGKSDDWIKVNLANEYGFVSDGKPVHPFYTDSVHCVDMAFAPDRSIPIVLGFDFGRTPACAIMQQRVGTWIIGDELTSENTSAVDFAPMLKKYLDQEYQGFTFKGWGDPAGGHGNQSTNQTPIQILQAAGIPCAPTYTNDPLVRRSALEGPLKTMAMDGKPRLLVLPKAKMIRKGLAGGFKYRRLQVSGSERYTEEPDKNEYSHPVEAAEYALLGEGEARSALTNDSWATEPVVINQYSAF